MGETARILGRRVTLRVGVGTAFVGVVLLTSLLLGGLTYWGARAFIREDIRRRLKDVATLASHRIDPELHRKVRGREDETTPEYRALKTVLRSVRDGVEDLRFVYTLRRSADGKAVFVVDAEDKEKDLSHAGDVYDSASPALRDAFEPPYRTRVDASFYTDAWGTWISGYAPVLRADGTLEAVLGVDISAARVVAYERRHLAVIAGAGALIGLGVALIALLVARAVTRPLLDLERDMARIQGFDLAGGSDARSRVVEVSSMQDAVENMRHGLRSFRRYVPADLVAELIRLRKEAVLGAERREMTVFFSDIVEFTGACERIDPDALMKTLGVYLKGMTEAILREGGTVDKFIGDGVMAFWGAPHPAADHATRACRAALACQRFIADMATGWQAQGLPPFPTRIGINTGEVLVGNVGYEERMNYTVMGDPVNVASRLEELNKRYGTRVLIGETVRAAVGDQFEMRLLDRVVVKGKSRGQAVYELVAEKDGIPPERRAFLGRFGGGVERYFARDWAGALAVFEATLRETPGDEPSRIYIERCRTLLASPPGPDWDGVTVMRVK
jgi:class 3 adenylate cyclase